MEIMCVEDMHEDAVKGMAMYVILPLCPMSLNIQESCQYSQHIFSARHHGDGSARQTLNSVSSCSVNSCVSDLVEIHTQAVQNMAMYAILPTLGCSSRLFDVSGYLSKPVNVARCVAQHAGTVHKLSKRGRTRSRLLVWQSL